MSAVPENARLIGGPYSPPQLQPGDRAYCRYRRAWVRISSITDALLPWPAGRTLTARGGSTSPLVDAELARAIRTESAAALAYWFGVGANTVTAWRKALCVPYAGTEGSRRLYQAATAKATVAARDRERTAEELERRGATSRRLNLIRHAMAARTNTWTAAEAARRTGRTLGAVYGRRKHLRVVRQRKGRP